MFPNSNLSDWENLVKKQLKTEDIYEVLNAENLEGLELKTFLTNCENSLSILPKIEDSTHLVAPYHESLEDSVFAFLLDENVPHLADKSLFINNKDLAEYIKVEDEDQYFSLIDVFGDTENLGQINSQLSRELLAKNFKRNICIDVVFHQNCGASIVQQMAIALAKAKDLVEIFGKEILNKIIVKVAIGANYFFEIAKIRALKLLYLELSKEYDLAEIPFIYAETSFRNKSSFDAENNLIRSSFELAAAMIGGADAVFSNNYLIDKKSALSAEISFKQQIILAYESILNVFEDAANGSYFVEDLTRQIAEKSWKLFLDFEENGGYCEIIKSKKLLQLIYNQAVNEQKWVAEGKIKLIGVNLYPSREPTKEITDLYDPNVLKPVRWAEMFE